MRKILHQRKIIIFNKQMTKFDNTFKVSKFPSKCKVLQASACVLLLKWNDENKTHTIKTIQQTLHVAGLVQIKKQNIYIKYALSLENKYTCSHKCNLVTHTTYNHQILQITSLQTVVFSKNSCISLKKDCFLKDELLS